MREWFLQLYSDATYRWQPRKWLRAWLGIEDPISTQDLKNAVDETFRAICQPIIDRLAKLEAEVRGLEQSLSDTAQGLQMQITELGAPSGPIATKKPSDPEPAMVMPGHIRFSDRKHQYEASKRKPLTTPAGEQIEANSRLIASGTRRTDET
jgi:hypothetical protein